jgi:hypothetical protein
MDLERAGGPLARVSPMESSASVRHPALTWQDAEQADPGCGGALICHLRNSLSSVL